MAKKETSYARAIGVFILIFLKLIEEAFRSRYISQGKRNGEEGEEVQINDAETCQVCNMERKETQIFYINKEYLQLHTSSHKD